MPLDASRRTPADTSALAAALGAFLHALHSFPVPEALALGVPGPDVQRGQLQQVRTTVLPPLRAALPAGEYRSVEQWWDRMLSDPAMTPDPAALCHGDLWYENVLVDPMRSVVTGVVDFEDANVGDPAQDFAALRYLGDRFVAATIDAYRVVGAPPPPPPPPPATPHPRRLAGELRPSASFTKTAEDPIRGHEARRGN